MADRFTIDQEVLDVQQDREVNDLALKIARSRRTFNKQGQPVTLTKPSPGDVNEATRILNEVRDEQVRLSRPTDVKLRREFQYQYPLSTVENIPGFRKVKDQIMDIIWDGFIRWTTCFESLDGFDTNNASFTTSGIELTASSPSDPPGHYFATRINDSFLTFAKSQRFSCLFDQETITRTDVDMQIRDSSANFHGFGFRIVNNQLNGIVANNGVVSTKALRIPVTGTIIAGTVYNVEARYFPSNRVDFYVDGEFVGSTPSTDANFPSPTQANDRYASIIVSKSIAEGENSIANFRKWDFMQSKD